MPRPSSSAEPGAPARAEPELKLKLVWVTVFRTVAGALLLVALAARLLSGARVAEPTGADSLSFALIAVVFLSTLVYGVMLRAGFVHRAAAWIQVLGDVVLATALVYVTGGAESPFAFVYSLAVVEAAILLLRRGAFVAAVVTSATFPAAALAIELGVVAAPLAWVPLEPGRLGFVIGSHVLSQFLIAALAGYLSEQVTRAGGRLSAREADIRELVELQNRIVNAMPSGLLTCEVDGRITFINPAAATILGHPRDAVPGRHIDQVIPGVLRVRPNARRAELEVDAPSGRRTLGLAVTPLEGRGEALLVVFQDLTEIRRMEAELERIDHLASLGRLSAQLAHEIRNPLASMRGSAQLLVQDAPAGDANQRLVQVLMRESDRLGALVEDYLKLARPPPPKPALVRVDQVVAETVEMLRADPMAAGVLLEEQLAELTAWADSGQLKQVLINLLRNSFAAVGRGGRVRVAARDGGGQALVEVWDSAGSIPAEDLGRIFEPFYSTRAGGTGLGLSTVHAIVRAHGGSIEVTSSPQSGTTFTVGLPRQGAAEGPR